MPAADADRQAFVVGNSPYYLALTDMAQRQGMTVTQSFNTEYDTWLPRAKGHQLIVETHGGVPIVPLAVLDKFFPGASAGLKGPAKPLNIANTKIVFVDFSQLLNETTVDSKSLASAQWQVFIVGNSPYWETLTDMAKERNDGRVFVQLQI